MATLKEFEEALRQHGMANALAILDGLKKRDRERRSVAPARRVVGRKMTAELARTVLELHGSTGMTQQEIAFKLGVNQGRVNEVIKRGKWLTADPAAPEAVSRDKAMARLDQRARARRGTPAPAAAPPSRDIKPAPVRAARAPASVAPPVVPPARRDAELPLGRAEAPPPLASSGPRTAPRRPADPDLSIVSAQLAFLDL